MSFLHFWNFAAFERRISNSRATGTDGNGREYQESEGCPPYMMIPRHVNGTFDFLARFGKFQVRLLRRDRSFQCIWQSIALQSDYTFKVPAASTSDKSSS